MAKDKHFTIEEAARWLGEPEERTRLRVQNKELSLQGSKIPARALLHLYYASMREYFSSEQVAFALQRNQSEVNSMIRWGEIKAETIEGKPWISVEEMKRVISKREPARRRRIRRRLPNPQQISLQRANKLAADSADGEPADTYSDAQDTDEAESEDREENLEEDEDHYYTSAQAALLLGKKPDEVDQLLSGGALPAVEFDGYQWIPASVVDSMFKRKYAGKKPHNAPKPHKLRILDKASSERAVAVRDESPRYQEPREADTEVAGEENSKETDPPELEGDTNEAEDGGAALRYATGLSELSATSGRDFLGNEQPRMTSSEDQRNYYTDVEVSNKLGKSII